MLKGDTFESKFVITEKVYTGFISLFNDKNPLHTNAGFAKEKGFKSEVMHGNILNGFISYFVGECLPQKNVIIMAQEIKYVNPVYLNDILLLKADISDIFDSVKMLEIKFIFKNQNDLKVASGKINIGIL